MVINALERGLEEVSEEVSEEAAGSQGSGGFLLRPATGGNSRERLHYAQLTS